MNPFNIVRSLILGLFCFLLSNCASVFNRPNKHVEITSSPSGAAVTVTSSEGRQVHAGTTPTTAVLPTSRGYFRGQTYTVEISKAGYPERTVTLDARMSGWYLGNLVIGGVIGMLVIDPLTGSMWTLDEKVAVDLKSSSATVSLRIMDRADVPAAWEGHLVTVRN